MTVKPFFNLWDYGWVFDGHSASKPHRIAYWKQQLHSVAAMADRGVYLIDPTLRPQTVEIAERCREEGSTLTLGFRIDFENPDRHRIAAAAQIADELTLANTRRNEWDVDWRHDFRAERLAMDLCGEYGARWRCPMLESEIIRDMLHTDGRLSRFLVTHQVRICSLCGYLPVRLFGQKKVRNWLSDLPDPWSGAGKEHGLMNGTAVYCRKAGFSALVCSPPIPEEFPGNSESRADETGADGKYIQ